MVGRPKYMANDKLWSDALGKETRQWLDDYEVVRLRGKDGLTEKDIRRQIKVLGTPGGINQRKIADYLERRLVPDILTARGVPRQFTEDWSSEFDASIRSMRHLPL